MRRRPVNPVTSPLVVRRQELGMTQGEVGQRLGYTQATISNLEHSLAGVRVKTLYDYAQLVGLEMRLVFSAPAPVVEPAEIKVEALVKDLFAE